MTIHSYTNIRFGCSQKTGLSKTYFVIPTISFFQLQQDSKSSKKLLFNPLSANLTKYKIVKHTQTIRWQIADEFFEYVLPFCCVGVKGLRCSFEVLLYHKNLRIFRALKLNGVTLNIQRFFLKSSFCLCLKIFLDIVFKLLLQQSFRAL